MQTTCEQEEIPTVSLKTFRRKKSNQKNEQRIHNSLTKGGHIHHQVYTKCPELLTTRETQINVVVVHSSQFCQSVYGQKKRKETDF